MLVVVGITDTFISIDIVLARPQQVERDSSSSSISSSFLIRHIDLPAPAMHYNKGA